MTAQPISRGWGHNCHLFTVAASGLGGPALGSDYSPCSQSFPTGVSKIVTVDVKGNSPLWLKVKDLAEGMTYRFRIKAKTFTYGPEIEANITTGPGEGRRDATLPYAPRPQPSY